MRNCFAVVALIVLLLSPAQAQKVALTCRGMMYTYEPQRIEGSIPAGAAVLDIDNHSFTTPAGNFHIRNIDDASITFDDPNSTLKVFGRIDRSTGDLTIFWRRPEEEEKLQAGRESKSSRYAELKCAPAKRLF